MGRGRQKAKHIKVARKLKYFSPETDLDALQRELTSSGDLSSDTNLVGENQDDEDEEEYGGNDEGDAWANSSWEPPANSRTSAWDDYEG